MTEQNYNNIPEEQEIDIMELISKLWKKRMMIIKWCVAGAIIGLVVGYGAIIGGMMIMPIWWACLAISIPAVSVAAILFALKVKETKGANLDEIE